MTFRYDRLKGKIVEKFDSNKAFADAMGMTEATLSRKLNNKATWTQAEIAKACKLLEVESINAYFFDAEVQNLEPGLFPAT